MSRLLATCLLVAFAFTVTNTQAADRAKPLSLVVMDPLAAPLSCPCVEGYAQRKYEALAKYLEKKLGRSVEVTYAESLVTVANDFAEGGPDLVIGKDSVVRFDAKRSKIKLESIARLTGKDGVATQTGLFVVPAGDPAKTIKDLKGYRIVFGPKECNEKHAAAIAALKDAGVPIPKKIESSEACSDGACKVLELGDNVRAAAVISSYAKPLLEGCGAVEKGELRVVGETKPVAFISAFVNKSLSEQERSKITKALLTTGLDIRLCQSLETVLGFISLDQPAPSAPASPD